MRSETNIRSTRFRRELTLRSLNHEKKLVHLSASSTLVRLKGLVEVLGRRCNKLGLKTPELTSY